MRFSLRTLLVVMLLGGPLCTGIWRLGLTIGWLATAVLLVILLAAFLSRTPGVFFAGLAMLAIITALLYTAP